MADLVFVAVIIAFFVLSALYVIWCDRIVGPDEFAADLSAADDAEPVEPSRIAA